MFNANANLPLGTYVEDGLRSGPFYPDRISGIPGQTDDNGRLLSVTGQVYSTTHNTYGPGMLFPALRYDNVVTYPLTNPDGSQGLQFDYPRVPTVTISGAIATAGTRVTIFGFDYYYQPLQHTYVVSAIGTYPTVNAGPPIALSVGAKSFFGITRVYIDQALGAGSTISVGASNIFGLPYVINSFGSVLGIAWGIDSELTGAPTVAYTAGEPLASLGMFQVADDTPVATATTSDVRGLYAPSSASNGILKLLFTYYVDGANNFVNQQAAMNWPQFNNDTGLVSTVPPLAPADLYGVPQFYTGQPS